MKLVPSIPVLTSPILLAGLIGGALTIGAASLPVTASAQTNPAPKATSAQQQKPPVRKVVRKAKPAAVEPEPVIAAADEPQMLAAREVMLGGSGCEFGQSIQLDDSAKHPGYVDLSFNNRKYVMKPVLSSTGALRLEDVRKEALLIQIGNKTMLMNQKTGQRMVDNCVHAKQRSVVAAGDGASMLGEQAKK